VGRVERGAVPVMRIWGCGVDAGREDAGAVGGLGEGCGGEAVFCAFALVSGVHSTSRQVSEVRAVLGNRGAYDFVVLLGYPAALWVRCHFSEPSIFFTFSASASLRRMVILPRAGGV